MLERDVEKKVSEYAKSKGFLSYKWTSPGHMFVPDRIFISPKGVVIMVEFKQLGKKPTAGQLREHERLRNQNVLVFVIDNVDDGKRVIDNHV